MPQERIENKIFVIRGQKVMLSMHLAALYGVTTKVLLQAVKRNIERFPEDFMFQLTWKETDSLRSQIVTLKNVTIRGKHIKYLPYAFAEQ
ncbi:MAG: ORF6N domain-containing protein [Candidatus Omnitrophica bacterium]|nr:ORF6N domain-containing protein [Candidatus Omnitrophota bacterium]